MTDSLSPALRSERMARIRSKDTAPEMRLRQQLHRRGLRFRLHSGKLPGKPDLVFPRYKVVVFVHGCFWHRHEGCKIATTPKSNTEFWLAKFERNKNRDREVIEAIRQSGWKVIVVWECQLKPASACSTAAELAAEILGKPVSPEIR